MCCSDQEAKTRWPRACDIAQIRRTGLVFASFSSPPRASCRAPCLSSAIDSRYPCGPEFTIWANSAGAGRLSGLFRCRDERIQATIPQGCTEELSAEALIERLLTDVRTFCGEVAQEDDMTCVVVRVEAEYATSTA